MIQRSKPKTLDPLAIAKKLWPGVVFYKEQKEIIYSVWNNDETIVPAANKLGKDFVAGFIIVTFFLTRRPCRIITTSATDSHLDILWGEMRRFIQNSDHPLVREKGGPLIINHHHIRRVFQGETDPFSFIKGVVTRPGQGESLQGSHAGEDPFTWREQLEKDMGKRPKLRDYPRTLFVCDEASGVEDTVFRMARTWTDRMLILGNPWECNNYFYRAVEGDPASDDPGGDIEL